MTKKISLVLEGGGFRGAYTAGCLSWLIDEGIEFDNAYGISTGAVHLCSFLLKEKEYLFDLATNYICDKQLVGWRSVLREGRIVGYDYLFEHILPEVFHFDIQRVIKCKQNAKIGIYDLKKGYTEFERVQNIDLKMDLLKGACTLPILGRVVNYQGRELLDGGITKMIPIEESVKDGNDFHLVITTKPRDFVRKEASWVIKFLMKFNYLNRPCVEKDYAVRHINYNKQIDIIKKLEKEKKALYFYPTESVPVNRLNGDKENLIKLYELGRKDMEARRKEIYQFLNKE